MRRRFPNILVGCAICFAPSVCAQAVRFQSPVSGLVFSQAAKSIRTIAGIPGSAIFGDVVLANVQAAGMSPDGNSAIVRRDGGLFAVASLKSGTPVWRELHISTNSDPIVSWFGASALFFSEGRVFDWSGSPLPFDLAGLVVNALAFDGPSNRVLISARGGVFAGNLADGTLQLVLSVLNPVGLTIRSGNAFVADGDTGDIYRIQGSAERFAGTPGSDSWIAGLALSADARRLYVADRRLKKLWVYDTTTGLHGDAIDLSFAPDRLEPVSGGGLFLLSEEGPLYLLEDKTEPRVFFVPMLN